MYLIVIEFAKWLSNTKGFVKSTIEGYLRSVMLLDEYRGGKMGKISFEKPPKF